MNPVLKARHPFRPEMSPFAGLLALFLAWAARPLASANGTWEPPPARRRRWWRTWPRTTSGRGARSIPARPWPRVTPLAAARFEDFCFGADGRLDHAQPPAARGARRGPRRLVAGRPDRRPAAAPPGPPGAGSCGWATRRRGTRPDSTPGTSPALSPIFSCATTSPRPIKPWRPRLGSTASAGSAPSPASALRTAARRTPPAPSAPWKPRRRPWRAASPTRRLPGSPGHSDPASAGPSSKPRPPSANWPTTSAPARCRGRPRRMPTAGTCSSGKCTWS